MPYFCVKCIYHIIPPSLDLLQICFNVNLKVTQNLHENDNSAMSCVHKISWYELLVIYKCHEMAGNFKKCELGDVFSYSLTFWVTNRTRWQLNWKIEYDFTWHYMRY